MGQSDTETRYFVLKIESYEAEDTFLRCGNETQEHLFAIIVVDSEGIAEIVDSSYRTAEEALAAWPEAAMKST